MKALNQFSLGGKTAVVIGGTSGIGQTLAIGLAEAGADVVATSRTIDKVRKVTAAIESLGRKTMAITTDATNEKEMAGLADSVLDLYGAVDIVVNVVGINIRKPVMQFSYEEWRTVIQTNLDSVFLAVRSFGQAMIDRKYGKIINIGSMNSVIASNNLSAYAASKGGVVQLTKALAVELAPHGITVNAILPGYFHTEMTEPLVRDSATHARITARTPMKRFGNLDELVGTALYLASDASRFVTGETVSVDGGFLAFGVDLQTK